MYVPYHFHLCARWDLAGPLLLALLNVFRAYFFPLSVPAGDEVHLTRRPCLIVIPDTDCVRCDLGRPCAVPWLPAGQVCVRQL